MEERTKTKQRKKRKRKKTYNSKDSLVVTHLTTNLPACGLSTAERTGSPVLHTLWSLYKSVSLSHPTDHLAACGLYAASDRVGVNWNFISITPCLTPLPLALPFEPSGCIASYLSKPDIKNLRLSCVQFKNASILRIDRVFLPANPLNVEVFRCIAGHDKFRHSVAEIIWDEARLARGPHGFKESAEGNENISDEDEARNT
ncbi:hypothetical protein N7446_004778 [Penicillium canescens]|nr:hypothetical protein N7446_004778 [Penicillium canescens]